MGIEPTWDSYEPHTDFEDQGHHQEPVTSPKTPFHANRLTYAIRPHKLIVLTWLLSVGKGLATSWTLTLNSPLTSDGTCHKYRQLKPHPHSKLPW
jgi:hypothetical protein